MTRATRADTGTDKFIEQMAVLLEADGMPRVAGRMFAYLLMSDEACSLDDLARYLGVSKASVSINARLLEEKGVVERISRQSDRRDYYQISDEILERTLEQRINRWRRFHATVSNARQTCVIKHPSVRSRLESMDRIYGHMVDVTTRALEDWRHQRKRAGAPSATPNARSR